MAELLRTARQQFIRSGYRDTTMSAIAAAAGLTKRTLYQWHADKAALFRACVLEGAERFPVIGPELQGALAETLEAYLAALIVELSAEDSSGLGRLFVREGKDFPELAPILQRSYDEYLVRPLAEYLAGHGLEAPGSTSQTELLIAMALAPVHNGLLLGRPMPNALEARSYARQVTSFFLHRAAPVD